MFKREFAKAVVDTLHPESRPLFAQTSTARHVFARLGLSGTVTGLTVWPQASAAVYRRVTEAILQLRAKCPTGSKGSLVE
eukprot:9656276-Alexandrium_andersonii.AAC.1